MCCVQALYPSVRDETFLMTCGIGDLIATCYGGRNRLVAEAWTKDKLANKPTSFEELETVRCRCVHAQTHVHTRIHTHSRTLANVCM